MDFIFGWYIHTVHLNKSPLNILEKREHMGLRRDCSIFLEYLILSQEWEKLRTSNLAGKFTGSIEQKPIKILEKMERGRFQGLPKFFDYPLLSHEWVKL